MDDLLEKYYSAWDLVFIDQENAIMLNKNLPVVKAMYNAIAPERFFD